jgi:hypothetical protein
MAFIRMAVDNALESLGTRGKGHQATAKKKKKK